MQSRTGAPTISPRGKGDSEGAKATTEAITGELDASTTCEVSVVDTPVKACTNRESTVVSSTPVVKESTQPKKGVTVVSTPIVQKSTQPRKDADTPSSDVSTALLAQQLPPLPNFSGGDTTSEDSFQDWLGQFELVAEIYRWGKQAKLMHLVTRLN